MNPPEKIRRTFSVKCKNSDVYRNTFYGLVFNNLNEPDSALVHLQKAANIPIAVP